MSKPGDLSQTRSGAALRRPGEGGGGGKFNRTYSLLSQYIKQNGGLGDLRLGMMGTPHPVPSSVSSRDLKGKSEATLQAMNLLQDIEVPDRKPLVVLPDTNCSRTSDLFPRGASGGAATPANVFQGVGPCTARAGESAAKDYGGGPQMTIFYGGNVVVFDNFPADKANELMAMVSKEIPQGAAPTPRNAVAAPASTSGAAVGTMPVGNPATTTAPPPQGQLQRPAHIPMAMASAADLPIARKISLNRFLEKRKDRISSKAPYQVNGSLDIA